MAVLPMFLKVCDANVAKNGIEIRLRIWVRESHARLVVQDECLEMIRYCTMLPQRYSTWGDLYP